MIAALLGITKPNGHMTKLKELHEELKTAEHYFLHVSPCPIVHFCIDLIAQMPVTERAELTNQLQEILVKKCEHHFDGTEHDGGTDIG